ncbi:primase alpha helix C-terminal domain-containing protein [Lapidilactobacillus dextrinicus]|uniref:primase alpha helix C-terminal domain-containing protein n=1 Tax=Lapidilactobacillus dextrinicus TaxID=51664 RepID=UPI0022E53C9C|nr:primase alpha helix C-terminal domain-containing protein [Lapidilactobacillus dextrinicus]
MIYGQSGLHTNQLIGVKETQHNATLDDFNFIKSISPQNATSAHTDNAIGVFKQTKAKYFIAGNMVNLIRSNDNLLTRSVLALDFDETDNEQALLTTFDNVFRNTAFIRYPSISYGFKGARYRLILAVDRSFNASEYEQLYSYFAKHLPLDTGAKAWSQVFGLPIINRYSTNLTNKGYLVHTGKPLNVDKTLELCKDIKPQSIKGFTTSHRPTRNYTTKVVNETNTPITDGQRHTALTSYCGKLFRAGINSRMVYELLSIKNNYCEPPLPERDVISIFTNIAKKEQAKGATG